MAIAFPSAASAAVLYDGIDTTPPGFITSQDFEASFDDFDAVTADDFTVPVGKVWHPSAIRVTGFKVGATSTSAVNVNLYSNAGTLPGSQFFSTQAQAAAGTTYPDFNLPVPTAPVLAPGTYWLGVQARLDGVSPGNPQQWFWRESSEGSGSPPAFVNPGNGFNSGCTTFSPKSACPLPKVPPPGTEARTGPGQSFSIDGVQAPAKLSVSKAKAKSAGKLALTLSVPNVGKLQATSPQMKGASKTVREIGKAQLVLSPTAETKGKLSRGRPVTATVNLSLPGLAAPGSRPPSPSG
ncbi:MAG: hypothetical protein U0R52_04830 [Solirubrobacterales bacterium]